MKLNKIIWVIIRFVLIGWWFTPIVWTLGFFMFLAFSNGNIKESIGCCIDFTKAMIYGD